MRFVSCVCIVVPVLLSCTGAYADGSAVPDSAPLYAGWATIDITPDKPVALVGQLHKRISQRVRDPLTATALALETRGPQGTREQALLISCDVLYIRKAVQEELRQLLKIKLPDFDANKLLLNATHTHTGPGFLDEAFGGLYDVSHDVGVMKASEYADFFLERVAQVAVKAWRTRKRAAMSWALGHAVIGTNRRVQYFDGSAAMYGSTDREDFSGIEGYEDHGLELLFFWNDDKELTGIVINVACPAQETEGLSEISADFWHDVRTRIHETMSKDVFILPQCAAAGDLSPHLVWRKRAEDVMRQRRGLSNRAEIARRIVTAVDSVLPLAKADIQTSMVFKHTVARVKLPAQAPALRPFYLTDTVAPIEFHVLRLGDVALATNPFELYLDYGVRIKARSPAVLTLVTQLSCQHCGYLPTTRATKGGGYSADKYVVGPEGGRILVDKTVEQLNSLWD
jgi:hypothetical protein